jgi:Cys-tRNA(Pro)/Cys-tRNA(Cys) deacylase
VYEVRSYEGGALSGTEVAKALGEEPTHVFKTLVTVGSPRKYYVFCIPVEEELDLKKAAQAAGEKSIAMLPLKELFPLTGYVHGGCSPLGMKKQFPTFFHESAEGKVFFSGGKIGLQIGMEFSDLSKAIPLTCCDLIRS